MKDIILKLTKGSAKTTPFKISDVSGNVIATDVTRNTLIAGVSYTVEDDVNVIVIESTGDCKIRKVIQVGTLHPEQLASIKYSEITNACLWRHLTNVNTVYNNFYGKIHPYIIEYPFAYQYHNEILQNVKDYTKVYKYSQDDTGVFSYNDKIEVDNVWFNKAVVYNGQQSSGILELVPKPLNNLKEYMKYPIFNDQSKTITYTKSDNFYHYNTFWSLVKNKQTPLFLTSCESLSIDKIVNQANMDYGLRSFKKEPIRAKELKIRHILDNKSDVNLVSQFLYAPAMLSYK